MNTSPTLSSLEALFAGMALFAQQESEATLLSIGGRGYYENPTSDLLQFFFRPDNAHGLGTLFIDAFLETANLTEQPKVTGAVTVQRELGTEDRKRIDLIIETDDWLLMIENKIWHHQNNPFDSYESLARKLARGRELYYVVLSPNGDSERDNWNGVSYAPFLQAIDERLAGCTNEQKTSKWFHFAQDFTLHLSQELYQQAMTPEEIEFVEQNLVQLDNATQLHTRYRDYLKDHLRNLLNEAGETNLATVKDETWAVRATLPHWKGSNIAWWNNPDDEQSLNLTVYLEEFSEDNLPQAKSIFEEELRMQHWHESQGTSQYWTTIGTPHTKEEAEAKVRACVCAINEIYPSH